MEMNSEEAQQRNMLPIKIWKVKSDFESLNDYQVFLDELMSKCIHRLLKQTLKRTKSMNIPHAICELVACEKLVGGVSSLTFLAYEELDCSINSEIAHPAEGVNDLSKWVAQFNLKSWGDWLMV